MPNQHTADCEARLEAVAAAWRNHGDNVSAIARETELDRRTVRRYLDRLGVSGKPVSEGSVTGERVRVKSVPRSGVRRYILTAAQNNTRLHTPFWNNLLALADHYGAQILVGAMAYNANNYARMSVKPGAETDSIHGAMWYAPEVVPYMANENILLAPGLICAGKMNISPTAVTPLSGLQTYTRENSGIFPHTKIQLESIPNNKFERTKVNTTTGACTLKNYIPRKAGLKAEFHHVFGAVMVEVDSDGDYFIFHVIADDEGNIQHLDTQARDGRVITGCSIENLTAGDFHGIRLDPVCRMLTWEEGGLIDWLRPSSQVLHDTFDMESQNHHDRGNIHRRFDLWARKRHRIADELQITADQVRIAHRDWLETIIADSNHDQALTRFLREHDPRKEEANLEVYLELQARLIRALKEGDKDFHLLEWALRKRGCPEAVRFLRQDESCLILDEIEAGNHGDLGPNGSRGTLASLAKIGRKQNIGHSHSAGIKDGVYQAGTNSILDLGYNAGPSSWSHCDIITYPHGKRTLLFKWNGKYRAGMKPAVPAIPFTAKEAA